MRKKIIINGVSSFTGYHFTKFLSKTNKYEILCLVSKGKKNEYQKKRLSELSKSKNLNFIYDVNYFSNKFFKILKKERNFTLVLHYAYNKNYKTDENFDLNFFIKNNLFKIEEFYKIIFKKCNKIILTNSYFQKNENTIAYNKYGLSKDINFLFHEYYCEKNNIELKINTISNPFGEMEEKRLLYYVISSWNRGLAPILSNPHDKNDFILIDSLAEKFVEFIESKEKLLSLSQYAESNLEFISRLKVIYEKLNKKVVKLKFKNSKVSFSRNNSQKIKKDLYALKKYIIYASKEY